MFTVNTPMRIHPESGVEEPELGSVSLERITGVHANGEDIIVHSTFLYGEKVPDAFISPALIARYEAGDEHLRKILTRDSIDDDAPTPAKTKAAAKGGTQTSGSEAPPVTEPNPFG